MSPRNRPSPPDASRGTQSLVNAMAATGSCDETRPHKGTTDAMRLGPASREQALAMDGLPNGPPRSVWMNDHRTSTMVAMAAVW
jgi:hypothetical protein